MNYEIMIKITGRVIPMRFIDTFILLVLYSDKLQEARQIIILLGVVATRALVRVDRKSYYEIIINGIMSEVTRYVFE